MRPKSAALCAADSEVRRDDVTSTYFEAGMDHNPKARQRYSRDHWPDSPQVVIARLVMPDRFPLAQEVMSGRPTEQVSGKAWRDGVMDGGIPIKATFPLMREPERQTCSLAGNPGRSNCRPSEGAQRDGQYLLRTYLSGEDPAVRRGRDG